MKQTTRSGAVIASAQGMRKAGPWTTASLTFLFFLLTTALATGSSLNAPFFWDDLHLIRVYTPQELGHVWSGNWDPDGIETPGFRPLTTYFNHFRAVAFGESVVAHRIFLLVLFSLFLTLVAVLGQWLFEADFYRGVLAGLLVFFHLTSVYHYFWISDGIHVLSVILIISAVLALLQTFRSGQPAWLLISWLCAVLAILAREDSLTLYPLLLAFALACVWIRRQSADGPRPSKLWLGVFAAAVTIAGASIWYWRNRVVPNALPPILHPEGLAWAISEIVQNAGSLRDLIHPWPAYFAVIRLWQIWLGILLIVGALVLNRQQQKQALVWGAALVLAALPTLVTARSNLLLLPVTFWCALVAWVLTELWRSSGAVAVRALAGGMILFALAAPAAGSLTFIREQRPQNLVTSCVDAWFIYTEKHATIPEGRGSLILESLSRAGMASWKIVNARYPSLIEEAKIQKQYGLSEQGLPFIPRFYFIQTYPQQWICLMELK